MPDVGKVRYTVDVDNSNADKQIDETEKKIKKIGAAAEESDKKIASSAKRSQTKIKSATDEAAEGLKKSNKEASLFSDALGKVPDGAIGKLNSSIAESKKSLEEINSELKKTPDNIELAAQKYRITKKEIADTKSKLDALKNAQDEARQAFENGKIGEKTYRAIRRETSQTKTELKKLKSAGRDAFKELARTGAVVTGIEKIGKAAKKVGTVGFSAIKGIGNAFVALAGAAAAGVGAVAKMGIEYNAQMQTYQTAFTTMLGDAEKAQQLTDNLKTLAAHTPLAMADLADASQILLAFGSSAESLPDQLKRLGDVAQGDAQKLGTMATAFGRIQSNGRASLEEINMMIDQGFNPLSIIAEKTGESMEEVRDRVSAGKVSFEEISEALQTATDQGGQFYNAMENQSKTFEGQISTMKDNVSALAGTLTSDLFANLTQDALPQVNEWITTLLDAAETGGVEGAIETSGTILTEAITGLLNGAPQLIETAESLIGSFLDSVANTGPEIMDSAVEVVLTLVSGLVNSVLKLRNAGGSLIAGLIDGIANHFPDIIQIAAQAIINLVTGFINNIPKIIAAAARLMVAFVKAILTTDWIQLGRDLVNSIIDGISRAWQSLVSWFNGLWNSLFGGRTVNVGVNSSVNGSHATGLEYVPFDGYIAELHKGEMVIPSHAAEDYRAGRFEDFNRSMAEEFALDVNYNMPHTSDISRDITAGISGNFTGRSVIEVPVMLDGREIARASAWYIGEQLAWEER